MPLPTPVTPYEIAQAMASWEATEFATTYTDFHAYVTCPTQEEFEAGVVLPFSSHRIEDSDYESVSINSVDSVQDKQVHKFWTLIMFGKEGNPTEALIKRDMDWRPVYRAGFLKHLRLGITGQLQITVQMGKIQPASLQEGNEIYVGIQIPVTVTLRYPLSTQA